jgi:hypothetical protein
MKKATKLIFIVIILGAFALTGGGCGKEEEDDFDFSMYMRIDEQFDEVDWSGFDMADSNSRLRINVSRLEHINGVFTSWTHPNPDILISRVGDNSEIVVNEEKLRAVGLLDFDGDFYFKVMLNGKVIPYGESGFFDNSKYGIEPLLMQPWTSFFFTNVVLEEGQNVLEFFLMQEATEEIATKVIYIYYNKES